MIVKVIPRKTKSFGQLLRYMQGNDKKFDDQILERFVVKHNIRGETIEEWEQQFNYNEEFRQVLRRDSNILYHSILSFHGDDTKALTREKLEDLTRQYVKSYNPKAMFVALPHVDKGHIHVHICHSALEYRTGRSIRLSQKEFQDFKVGLQHYQISKYPELSGSVVQHEKTTKGLVGDKEYQYKARTGRSADKENLVNMLEQTFGESLSKADFFNHVQAHGLETYQRGGKTTGLYYEGRKYRFKTLGFDNEKFNDLDKVDDRLQQLASSKERSSISRC